MRIAETVGTDLTLHLLLHSKIYDLSLTNLPLDSTLQPMIGFVSAASDVYAQSLGGKAGGNGGVNGTLRVFQKLFPEDRIEELLETTFHLHDNPTQSFLEGMNAGGEFGNGIAFDDIGRSIRAAHSFFPNYYKAQCGNPSGKRPESDA